MGLVSFLHRIVARPRSWVRSIALRARVEAEMSAELADHAATGLTMQHGERPSQWEGQ
jgi:hypothetical protein